MEAHGSWAWVAHAACDQADCPQPPRLPMSWWLLWGSAMLPAHPGVPDATWLGKPEYLGGWELHHSTGMHKVYLG